MHINNGRINTQLITTILNEIIKKKKKILYSNNYTLSRLPRSLINKADCCRSASSSSLLIASRRDGVFSILSNGNIQRASELDKILFVVVVIDVAGGGVTVLVLDVVALVTGVAVVTCVDDVTPGNGVVVVLACVSTELFVFNDVLEL